MNKSLSLILTFFLIISCGGISKSNMQEQLPSIDDRFTYTDKNGEFQIKSSTGFDKKTKTFITKKSLEIPNRDKNGILEQSVAISSLGTVKNKTIILRPKSSHYIVWFDGKKYSSELKINPKQKAIDLKMTSPEKEWNGTKQIKFPSSKVVPCFFSQVIECAKVSGFIKKATEKKSGVMNFLVVWEGYPYLNETFTDFPSELFSNAELEYDGKTKQSERRFNLRVAGQSIFYVLNEKDVMTKMFWVSQGISMVSKSVGKDEVSEEGGDFE